MLFQNIDLVKSNLKLKKTTGIRLIFKLYKKPYQMTFQSGRRIGTIFLVFKKDPLIFIRCVSCGRPYFCVSTHRLFAGPIEKKPNGRTQAKKHLQIGTPNRINLKGVPL